MSPVVELIVIAVAALGATGWYVAQQAYIDGRATLRGGAPGDSEPDKRVFAMVAPAVAGVLVAVLKGIGALPGELRDFELGTREGALLIALSGGVIGVYYCVIGETAQARGKGVFAVAYYVPLLISTTLVGMLLDDVAPKPIGWVGGFLGMVSIVIIRWPGRAEAVVPTIGSGRWTTLLVVSIVGSLAWTAIQRFTLGHRTSYHISPGAFAVCSPLAAASVVALLSFGRSGVFEGLRSSLCDGAARKRLLTGGVALGFMYAALAVGLVHDLTRFMWLYYTLMIILLALAGRFVVRHRGDRLRLHQWIAILVAAASAALIYAGKR